MKAILLFTSLMLVSSYALSEAPMNQQQLEQTIIAMSEQHSGENGMLQFQYRGLTMYCISDAAHDRMRIVAGIAEYSDVTDDQIDKIMESNFHHSLDARYGVSDGVLYAAYLHPLSSLSEDQIQLAVLQVFNLTASFGTEYSSGVMSFGGQQEPPETGI